MVDLTEKFVQSRKDKGEIIGGGFLIFRRGKKTGRIGIKKNVIAFEHGDLISALSEVDRLTAENPGEKFVVFKQVTF